MSIIRPFKPGDPVAITWAMLDDVPAIVRAVRSGGNWISVAIDPKDLENRQVERAGYFRISPDGYVHLEVQNDKGEIKHRTGTMTYGELGAD